MNDAALDTTVQTVSGAVAKLESAVDPSARQAEFDHAMAPFTAEDGPWRFAPAEERRRAAEGIRAEMARRAGLALFEVAKIVAETEPVVEALVQESQEPPDPLASYALWRGRQGQSADEQIGILQLDELYRRRFRSEYAGTKPMIVLADYRRALTDPYAPENAARLRFIERTHALGFDWAPNADDANVAAVSQLGKLIADTRAARVPEKVRGARAAVQAAKRAADAARQLHRVEAIRP